MPSRRRDRFSFAGRRPEQRAVVGLIAASAGLAALAPVEPAGVVATDRLLAAAFATGVAFYSRRARRWTFLAPAGVGAVFAAGPLGVACGVGGFVAAVAAGWRHRRSTRLAVASGGLAANALLRLDPFAFHGAPTLIVLAALAPLVATAWARSPSGERRGARLAAAVVGGVVLVAVAASAVSLLTARSALLRGQRELDAGIEAARGGDDLGAVEHMRDAAGAFAAAGDDLDAIYALAGRAVPVLGHNLRGASVAADIAADVSSRASEVLARATSDALTVRDGRVPVDALAALAEPAGAALDAVDRAVARAADAQSPWLLPPVGDRYAELRTQLDRGQHDLDLAVGAIDAIPRLLGGDGPRRYLVLFVTPVEARPSGFPGNYAEVVASDGGLDMVRFGRMDELERATPPESRTLELDPDQHAMYDRFLLTRYFRNLTVTPDFPTVAESFRQLYPQAGGQPLDGVLSVDPSAIAALLRLTGPITPEGFTEPITHENAEQYLLRDQYSADETAARIDALETLGQLTFDRLTTGDLPGPTTIADVLAPAAHDGHLRFVAFEEGPAGFLEQVGTTGALPPLTGDALAVTNINAIGGKIDLFLERDLDYDVAWDPVTGEVRARLTVTLRNGTPSTGLPPYMVVNSLESEGANLPVGTNRTFLSVFTPWRLDGLTVDGQPVGPELHTELGRNVYVVRLDLAPDGGTATAVFELSGLLAPPYELGVWTQLLARPDHLRVSVDAGAARLTNPTNLTVNGGTASTEVELTGPLTLSVTTR